MAESEKTGRTWLKYGCFGCLGVIAAVALLVGTLAAVAALKVRSEEVEDRALTQELPAPDADDVDVASGGRVILELEGGEFHVEPGRPGDPLRIDATYDRGSHELLESFEPDTGDGWTYRVGFHQSVSGAMSLLKGMFGGTNPKLVILLPTDVPMDLEVRQSGGALQMELGGLWLKSAELRISKAGGQIAVSEPVRVPLERLVIDAAMTGVQFESLGNASPRKLDVELSMGGFDLDLTGEWLTDAQVSIDSRMSGTAVRLPRGVRIEGLDTGRIGPIEEPEQPLPTLTFTVTTDDRGDLRVIP